MSRGQDEILGDFQGAQLSACEEPHQCHTLWSLEKSCQKPKPDGGGGLVSLRIHAV